MKNSRPTEGEALVAKTEKSLREAIIDLMESSSSGGAALLINNRYFPNLAKTGEFVEAAEALEESASSCVDLRINLGLPVVGSVGTLFLDASQELCTSEQHLNDPIPLCEALLRALKGEAQK
jgi:hypothetical protein